MKITKNLKYAVGIVGLLGVCLTLFVGCGDTRRDGAAGEFEGVNGALARFEEQKALEKKLGDSIGDRRGEVLIGVEVYKALMKNGVTNLVNSNISHMGYRKVDKEWVVGEFSKKFREFLFTNGVLKWYEEGQFNCEDYSLGASFYAKVLNRLNDNRISGVSVAAGIVYYVPDVTETFTDPRHSINFFITIDDKIIYYEPQLQREVKLSPQEIKSIYYWEI